MGLAQVTTRIRVDGIGVEGLKALDFRGLDSISAAVRPEVCGHQAP